MKSLSTPAALSNSPLETAGVRRFWPMSATGGFVARIVSVRVLWGSSSPGVCLAALRCRASLLARSYVAQWAAHDLGLAP